MRTAIVLGGGRSSRMGRDKLALQRDGRSLLARTCGAAARHADRVIVAGHEQPDLEVEFVLEDPPFGGPVAGIAAALALVEPTASEPLVEPTASTPLVESTASEPLVEPTASPALVEPTASELARSAVGRNPREVLLLAGDLANPEAVVDLLVTSPLGADGVVLVDDEGWPQYLAGRYLLDPLLRAAAAADDLRDLSVRRFLRHLDVHRVPAPASVTADVDTPEQARTWGF